MGSNSRTRRFAMTDDTLYMGEIQADTAKKMRDKTFLTSKLSFIKTHNGLRPGCIHLFVGLHGAGKSTLMRTLLRDILENNDLRRVGLWLSEETTSDVALEVCDLVDRDKLKTVATFSELSFNHNNVDMNKMFVQEFIERNKPEVLIFDNLTTSPMYQASKYGDQIKMISWLKKIAEQKDIPVIIFAHTGKWVKRGGLCQIQLSDIAGNNTIGNYAQYAYIMQQFFVGDDIYSTMRIDKCRGYNITKRCFLLPYASAERVYRTSLGISHEEFTELLKRSNKE